MTNNNTNRDEVKTVMLDRRSFAKAMLAGAGAVGIGAIAGLNLFTPSLAFALPTSAQKQAEADELSKKLETLAVEADKASADHFTAMEAHDAALGRMSEAETSISTAEAETKRLQERLGSRATSMYTNGEISFLQVLFGAKSFSEFTSTWQILSDLSEEDAKLITKSKAAKQEAETARDEYKAQEKVAQQKLAEAEEAKAKADEAMAENQALLASMEAEIAELIEQERIAAEERQRAAAEAAIRGGGGGGGNYGSAPTYNPVTGNSVVDRAYGCMGLPYGWGACGPYSFDCSGLVSYALTGSFSRLGTTYTFMGWPRVADPQPGDVCTHTTHCGIYIGGGQMIHAPQTGDVVRIGPVQSGMIFVRW